MRSDSGVGNEPGSGSPPGEDAQRDLLRTHSRQVACLLALVGVALFLASFSVGDTRNLPADAFGWTFGLQLLRAGIAVGVVWTMTLILLRGWGGLWPSRISTGGIEFAELSRATEELEKGAQIAIEVTRGLAELREEKR